MGQLAQHHAETRQTDLTYTSPRGIFMPSCNANITISSRSPLIRTNNSQRLKLARLYALSNSGLLLATVCRRSNC